MEEAVLMESATLRQKFCTEANTSILDKIGDLATLPETGWAMTEQVAAFYEISMSHIKNMTSVHKEEFIADGYQSMPREEFKKQFNITPKSKARHIAVFPKKAVLRVGMLLRRSEVAKSVRTYLIQQESSVDPLSSMASQLTEQASQISQHAVVLSKNAVQTNQHAIYLTEHATQLSEHAGQLAQNAEQLISQARMITAVVNEVYRNRDTIQKLEDKFLLHEERLQKLECAEIPKTVSSQCISREQAAMLRSLAKKTGKPHQAWRKFNQFFGLTRYQHLPADKFSEAQEWFDKQGDS